MEYDDDNDMRKSKSSEGTRSSSHRKSGSGKVIVKNKKTSQFKSFVGETDLPIHEDEESHSSKRKKSNSHQKRHSSVTKAEGADKGVSNDIKLLDQDRRSIGMVKKRDSRKESDVDEPETKLEMTDSDDDPHQIFRVANPEVKKKSPEDDKQSETSSKFGVKRVSAPPPSSVEEEFYVTDSAEADISTFEDGEEASSYAENESKEGETDAEKKQKSRTTLLREKWERALEMNQGFNSPTRVFKLRRYHSEPDLSIPFEYKFYPKLEAFTATPGMLRKCEEKYVSCEDIAQISTREHPDLVRGVLSEVKLRSYAIDDNMKNSWWELYEWERKRYSFFDELFAMGYVVDSWVF